FVEVSRWPHRIEILVPNLERAVLERTVAAMCSDKKLSGPCGRIARENHRDRRAFVTLIVCDCAEERSRISSLWKDEIRCIGQVFLIGAGFCNIAFDRAAETDIE